MQPVNPLTSQFAQCDILIHFSEALELPDFTVIATAKYEGAVMSTMKDD